MIILVFISFFCTILVFILFSFFYSRWNVSSIFISSDQRMLLKSDTMSLQQLVQSTSAYRTACLFSVHVVKSVSHSTVWFSFKQARICSDLYILLHLPLHSNPHSEEILSTYACEAGAAIASCANGASSGRDAAFCSQYARAGVDSAECWTSIRLVRW